MEFIIIENDPVKAKCFEAAGIERIMIDLEKIGKAERQAGLNTVISNHTVEDVALLRQSLSNAKLLVRTNPWHKDLGDQIDAAISNGADMLMLPMFSCCNHVQSFIDCVSGRAKTILLFETPAALVRAEQILKIKGIDEVYLGLNDLSIAMKLDFMFELLAGGIVDYFAMLCKQHNIAFGFGGIASTESGEVSGSLIIKEHARVGSTLAILSRKFKEYVSMDETCLNKQVQTLKTLYREAQELSSTEICELKEKTFSLIWQRAARCCNYL